MRLVSERELAVVLGSLAGTAVIWGHDASGQAEQIISQVAHPAAREQLSEAAASLGLRALLGACGGNG